MRWKKVGWSLSERIRIEGCQEQHSPRDVVVDRREFVLDPILEMRVLTTSCPETPSPEAVLAGGGIDSVAHA